LRLQHPIFYKSFNCVNGGPYRGWKAYSSLLGFIQAAVQFVAAMIQSVLPVFPPTLLSAMAVLTPSNPPQKTRAIPSTPYTINSR
jgi:hypothetical protein